jgi:hypothetical protein
MKKVEKVKENNATHNTVGKIALKCRPLNGT